MYVTARSQGAAISLMTDQARSPAKEGQLADRQQETALQGAKQMAPRPSPGCPYAQAGVRTTAEGNKSERAGVRTTAEGNKSERAGG